MAKPLLAEGLWERVEPLLPLERAKPKGGRPRISNRQVLTGILFVLRTGCPWEYFPQELGYGSGMTCWRRLRDWQQAGVFERLHQLLLAKLHQQDLLDLTRAVCDSASLRALLRATKPGLAPSTALARQQAPPDHRRQRHPARLPTHRRQRQRHHPA